MDSHIEQEVVGLAVRLDDLERAIKRRPVKYGTTDDAILEEISVLRSNVASLTAETSKLAKIVSGLQGTVEFLSLDDA